MTHRWLAAAALALLAIAPFVTVLGGEAVLDDEYLLHQGVATGERPWWEAFTSPFLEGRVRAEENAYYRPLTLLLFRAEHELAGDAMLLAHATNILLHAAATLLLWRLLRRRLPVPRAWLGAALFAVHPVHAESVAWVSGRTDVLCAVLLLATLLLLPRRRWAAAAAFLAALLAKETAVVLPAVVFLCGRHTLRERLRRVLPLVVAFLVYILLRLVLYWRPETTVGLDPLAALPTAPGVLGTYLRLLVVPFPLAFQRPIEIAGSPLRGEFLVSYALLVAAAWLFVRRRDLRPYLLWMLLFLLPVCGPFPVLTYEPGVWPFGERFLYVPSLGFAALAAALLPTARWLWVPLLAAGAGFAAWHSAHFRSTTALVESALRWYPDAASLYAIRGEVALAESLTASFGGDAAAGVRAARAAVADLERALSIRPGWYEPRRSLAQALHSANELARSERLFRELLAENRIDPLVPSNFAFLLHRMGRRGEARAMLLEALRRDPDFAPARVNLEQLERGR